MTARSRPADLVLGLGNVLCGDDGLGIAALVALGRRYQLPQGLRLEDGGTLGLSLLPILEGAGAVWILDAVAADAPPGSLVVLDGHDVEPALRERLSPHQIGVADLLDAMHWRGTFPRRLQVLGLVPERMDLRLGLSAPVEAALPALVEAAAEALRRAGHRLVPRCETSDGEMAGHDPGGLRALGL